MYLEKQMASRTLSLFYSQIFLFSFILSYNVSFIILIPNPALTPSPPYPQIMFIFVFKFNNQLTSFCADIGVLLVRPSIVAWFIFQKIHPCRKLTLPTPEAISPTTSVKLEGGGTNESVFTPY